MKSFKISGRIVRNNDAEIMTWFGLECVSPRHVSNFLAESGGEEVELLINSHGGDVHAAAEIYADLKRYAGKTQAMITGLAASAATVIALGCDRVVASPMAQMMIHNVSTWADGDHRDMASAKQSVETADAGLRAIYTRKTGKSMDELKKLMDAETWFSAETALNAGFVDEIAELEKIDLVASMPADVDLQKLRDLYAEQKAVQHEPLENSGDESQAVWQDDAQKRLEIEKVRYGE